MSTRFYNNAYSLEGLIGPYISMDSKTEIKLLKGIGNGDMASFDRLYFIYSSLVYNTALSYLQNVTDAEEVTQEVFIKICKKASDFKGNSSVKTWIYKITINTSINHLNRRNRDRMRMVSDAEQAYPDFVHPGVLLERKEKSMILFKCIDLLSPNQKTAFILAYIDDLPRAEVASIMDVSLKSVESLLYRAKINLKENIIKYYPNRGN